MHIVELISTGDGQIMETIDNIGIKLFVLVALKEYSNLKLKASNPDF